MHVAHVPNKYGKHLTVFNVMLYLWSGINVMSKRSGGSPVLKGFMLFCRIQANFLQHFSFANI